MARTAEWKSQVYGERLHGTGVAEFGKDSEAELKITYSAFSVFRKGETHTFRLKCQRNKSFCYGVSEQSSQPRIFICIPLDGSTGRYVTQGPADSGIMVFPPAYLEEIQKSVPDTDAVRPPQLEEAPPMMGCRIC